MSLRNGLIAAALCLYGLGFVQADAAENYQTTLIPGLNDVRAAELPPHAGWYALGASVYMRRNQLTDNYGHALFPDTNQTLLNGTLGLLYVFSDEVLGGRIGASVVQGYGRNNLTVTKQPIGANGAPLKGDYSGFFDMTTAVTWSRAYLDPLPAHLDGPPIPSGFTYSLGMAVTWPTGTYNSGNPIGTIGSGTITLSPAIAVTYRTPPLLLDGTEISVHFSYNNVRTRGDATGNLDYKDGDYVVTDFALTERWKIFQFGPAGTYLQQVQADSGSSALPDGSRPNAEVVKLGLVTAIDLSEDFAVRFKYLKDIHSRNSYAGDTFMMSFVKGL
jgi:hypothetical protein